ncbi:MAG: NAD-dependent epimerase/dehydratase family protein [Cyclobacteriaceae bacterium]|nr:NAD-dependent epimerase/dehydratase family protein [Cyclobacteriaceae bacterium]
MQTNILVTGGAGFVGRNLVARLIKGNETKTIWVIDDLSTGISPHQWPELKLEAAGREGDIHIFQAKGTPGTIKFIKSDVLPVFLGELGNIPVTISFKLPKMDYVYHLASIVGGRVKIDGDPLSVGLDLAIDSVFFLWAAKVNRPDRILYASSSAAYPISLQEADKDIALREEMIDFEKGFAAPDFTYGWSKLTGEFLSRIAHRNYGLSAAVIRPFSGYGEWQEPVYPVPAIAMRAAAKYDPLYVWGTGEQCRDFVHIEDCITCMLLAIENIKDGSAVNIGSGVATSFLELATLMGDIAGYKPKVKGKAGMPVGVAKRYCDPEYTREKLGFYPTISLREGMTRVVEVAGKRIEIGVPIPE